MNVSDLESIMGRIGIDDYEIMHDCSGLWVLIKK